MVGGVGVVGVRVGVAVVRVAVPPDSAHGLDAGRPPPPPPPPPPPRTRSTSRPSASLAGGDPPAPQWRREGDEAMVERADPSDLIL